MTSARAESAARSTRMGQLIRILADSNNGGGGFVGDQGVRSVAPDDLADVPAGRNGLGAVAACPPLPAIDRRALLADSHRRSGFRAHLPRARCSDSPAQSRSHLGE